MSDRIIKSSASIPPSSLPFESKQERIELLQKIENYLTAKFAVSCGRDTNEIEYDSLIEFWQDRGLLANTTFESSPSLPPPSPLSPLSSLSSLSSLPSDISKWYNKSHEYWQNQTNAPATIDGMLGGFAILSERDLLASRNFMDKVLETHCLNISEQQQSTTTADKTNTTDTNTNSDTNANTYTNVETNNNNSGDKKDQDNSNTFVSKSCECGAGIGRITKGLMIPLGISKFDLVETSSRLLQCAPEYIGEKHMQQCTLINKGLQDFHPKGEGIYDIIWIQWVIGYLTDWDLVSFLHRMGKALRPGGVIVIKDNCCNELAFLADCNDSDITRSFHYLMAIIHESDLKVAVDGFGDKLIQWQDDFPDDIWPVPMIVLERQ